jgi:hypothetical protein
LCAGFVIASKTLKVFEAEGQRLRKPEIPATFQADDAFRHAFFTSF